MAVATSQRTIAQYRQHYRRILLRIIIGSQASSALIITGILGVSGTIYWSQPLLWVIGAVIFVIGLLLLLMLMPRISEPLYGLLAALSHKIGEPTTTTPPNPNAKHHEKTGFKTALQAIYSPSNMQQSESTLNEDSEQPGPNTLLTQALNNTSCGVVILDSSKHIVSANRAAPIANDQDGLPFLALDFLDDQPLFDWLEEVEAGSISAEKRWSRISTNPNVIQKQKIYDIIASYQKGAAAETVIILFDRSDVYLPEQEDLNFIAFAAHELRGPITVIRGYLDVLEQELAGRLQGDEPQLLERLTVSASRLSGYINNILNVARFDRHHLQVHLAEDTVAHIYASIADDMQLRASAQHRIFNVSLSPDLPTVAADRGSISEVIANLIDNAIKYSFEGGVITLSAEAKGEFVEVSITDNGVGMPASVVKNLFHKFYRSHRSREAVAGTGIGLYISKAYVDSHGGSITARSKENEGSTFTFTLPIYATVKDKLLEDGQLNRQLIRHGGGWIKNHAMYRD